MDVTQTAREAGFKVPVALTANVWADVREIPASKKGIQDQDGRLWDLLYMGRLAAGRASNLDRHTITYDLHMDTGEGRARRRVYRVKLHIGPGDAGEPVVTLMRPEED